MRDGEWNIGYAWVTVRASATAVLANRPLLSSDGLIRLALPNRVFSVVRIDESTSRLFERKAVGRGRTSIVNGSSAPGQRIGQAEC